jgi:hypothetical protein
MRLESCRSRPTPCVVKLAFMVVQYIALVTSAAPLSSSVPTNYVIDSLECRARSSCHGQPNEDDPYEESISLTADNRNCRCDDKCGLYDDCCHDYRASTANDTASLKGGWTERRVVWYYSTVYEYLKGDEVLECKRSSNFTNNMANQVSRTEQKCWFA